LLQSFHGALGKEMLTNSYPIMTKQSFLQVSSFLQKKKKKKKKNKHQNPTKIFKPLVY